MQMFAFFTHKEIISSLETFEKYNLDLLGLYIKCYDNDLRAQISFMIFNFINSIMQFFIPFRRRRFYFNS
jgi:hypothetical protein